MSYKENSGQLIKMLNDAIERRVNNSLRADDLTMVQVWVLLSLDEKENHTYSFKELERILGVAQSTCVGIVSRLVAKKLVESFTGQKDRRMKLVRLSEDGKKRCEKAKKDIQELEQTLFTGFSEEEQAVFHGLLKRVYENVK